jgi:hypothetical protein
MFSPKIGDLAENCDHNIDPRQWKESLVYKGVGAFAYKVTNLNLVRIFFRHYLLQAKQYIFTERTHFHASINEFEVHLPK